MSEERASEERIQRADYPKVTSILHVIILSIGNISKAKLASGSPKTSVFRDWTTVCLEEVAGFP